MLPTLSEALRIAYSMDADAPADVQERQHHRNKMDRNAFHRALVTALTDPYTISGQRTAEKLKALEAKMDNKKESFVLDARFELGKRDDAYLQAPVLPLQTSDDDDRPLGMQLDPLFETAHRKGLYTALLEELRGKDGPYVDRLEASLRIAGWLMTTPEVFEFVEGVVEGNAEAKAMVADFKQVRSNAEGEVKIVAFIKAALSNLAGAFEVLKAVAVVCEDTDVTQLPGDLKALLDTDNAITTAKKDLLCALHGIHQLDDAESNWPNEEVPKAKEEMGKRENVGLFPRDDDDVKEFLRLPNRRNLDAAIKAIEAFIVPTGKAKDKDDLVKALNGELGTATPKSDLKYNLPKAEFVSVPDATCERPNVADALSVFLKTKKIPKQFNMTLETVNKVRGKVGDIAKWTPLDSDDEVAKAVATASCLEAAIAWIRKEKKKFDFARLVIARAKVKQLEALYTCVQNNQKFSGPSFDLPVLRCRARLEPAQDKMEYFKFQVNEGSLDETLLAAADGKPKAFEAKVALRDLGGVCMPYKFEGVANLRAALHDGLDAAEELRCNEEEKKKLDGHLKRLEQDAAEATAEGDDAETPDASQLVDRMARKRRRDVWTDGLREAALANDKLYSFVRQLGGAIGEPISEVAVVDDSKLAAESKQLRDSRQRAAQRAADQHADLVKGVITQVMRDSQLTLGISDQGNSFSGTSAGGAVDLSKIKIVSGALRREATELAGLGKDGDTDRFFGNAVKLESLLRSGTGEMSFADLLAQLRVAGQQLQVATAGEMSLDGVAGAGASIEFLSTPRNSLMLRWRPEALAAVRESFAILNQELLYRKQGTAARPIRAYELIEGNDQELSTLFATLCGLKMASSRLHSSSQSAYTSQWAARSNGQQLGVALQRVCRRAIVYALNNPGLGNSRQNYHQ